MKQSPPVLSTSQVLIIIFCLWHMAAVALYAWPDAARDPLTKAIRPLQSFVHPYILITSQWQQWNLFSPDPLRRVVTYRVEKEGKKGWTSVETLNPETFSILQKTAEFKFLERLLEGGKNQLPLVAHFLQQQCDAHALPLGTHVRLVYVHSTIPIPRHLLSLRDWHTLSMPEQRFIGSEILCGWPPGSSLLRAFP